MNRLALAFCVMFLVRAIGDEPVVARTACEGLTSLSLPNTTITLAQTVPAGTFDEARRLSAARPFCRVAATLRPSADSDIKIELWLPANGWNQKFQAVGNGAFNGAIAYPAMLEALSRGYATASTDTGHTGGGAAWALGHPEKVNDFGWRAVHEMTLASKLLIAAYYDEPLRFSYWNGCSAGGRQAMKEAQRFPADYDGIIAGSPGLNWTGRASEATRVAQTVETNAAARLTQGERELLHKAVVGACDAIDGLTDGLIDNPTRCRFDPATIQCTNGGQSGCLSAPQVETARLIYASGLQRGSELGWTDLGWTASARATGLDQFRFLVFKDPAWTIQKFHFESDIVRAVEADGGTINATDANLKSFFDRGGKLLQYHGWSDPQISPENSTFYYGQVLQTFGGASKVQNSYRLFMAPGMGHCGGGEGPNVFDEVGVIEQWVEQGKPPAQIVASHESGGRVDRTRPLCPFPQVAKYKGSGSMDQASNFVCAAP